MLSELPTDSRVFTEIIESRVPKVFLGILSGVTASVIIGSADPFSLGDPLDSS